MNRTNAVAAVVLLFASLASTACSKSAELDSNTTPVVGACGAGQIVSRTANGWECISLDADAVKKLSEEVASLRAQLDQKRGMPATPAADANKLYLRGDGEWAAPVDPETTPVIAACPTGSFVKKTSTGWTCSTVQWSDVVSDPATIPPGAHTHSASDVATGVLEVERLPYAQLIATTLCAQGLPDGRGAAIQFGSQSETGSDICSAQSSSVGTQCSAVVAVTGATQFEKGISCATNPAVQGKAPSAMFACCGSSAQTRPERVLYAHVSAAGVVSSSNGPWISSVTPPGINTPGQYELNFAPNTFSGVPVCVCTVQQGAVSSVDACMATPAGASTSSVSFRMTSGGGGWANLPFDVFCAGPRN
jgi:hypothetical protein